MAIPRKVADRWVPVFALLAGVVIRIQVGMVFIPTIYHFVVSLEIFHQHKDLWKSPSIWKTCSAFTSLKDGIG